MSAEHDLGDARIPVVSIDERSRFIEDVVAGKLAPDLTQVTYHFTGWLDKDVVDMVIEASSSPSEAVPDLAGMLPSCKPAEDHDRQPVSNEEAADFTGNDRQTMTLAAMQAQRSSSASGPVATPRAAEKVDSSESGSGSSNAQLEKVAAFISSYADEQEEAAKQGKAAAQPPASPFAVPRGTSVPSTRKAQLVIGTTAEKAVELAGFEAFLKMQHGRDQLFRFLGTDHTLHSYYLLAKQHVQGIVLKGASAKGACTSATHQASKEVAAASTAPTASADDADVQEIVRMLGGVGP